MSRIPSYAGRRTIFGAPRGWFFSKLDVASLHVILALRAARRAVFPVARCEIDGLSIAIRVSTPNEYHRADTYATKEPETIEWLRENLRDGDVFYESAATSASTRSMLPSSEPPAVSSPSSRRARTLGSSAEPPARSGGERHALLLPSLEL